MVLHGYSTSEWDALKEKIVSKEFEDLVTIAKYI